MAKRKIKFEGSYKMDRSVNWLRREDGVILGVVGTPHGIVEVFGCKTVTGMACTYKGRFYQRNYEPAFTSQRSAVTAATRFARSVANGEVK